MPNAQRLPAVLLLDRILKASLVVVDVRGEADGFAVRRDGVVVLPLLVTGIAQVRVIERGRGAEPHGSPELRLRLGVSPAHVIDQTEAVEGPGILRIKLDGALVGTSGVVVTVLQPAGVTDVGV